jgi:diguanylate cyclase (GGDEF)-like protein
MKIYIPKNHQTLPASPRFTWIGRLRQGVGKWAARQSQQIEQKARKWASAVQQPSEIESGDAETPLRRWKRQAIIWLFYVARRVRDSDIPPRCYRIGLASLVAAILLTFWLRGPLGGDCALFFLGAVVVSAGTGGLRAGLFTMILSLPPYACFLSYPHPTSLDSVNIPLCLLLFTLMALVTCILSDTLFVSRQQAETARQQAETQARRSRFLAQASAMLDDSQDYEGLLSQVTRAIVPAFADGATIEMIDIIDMINIDNIDNIDETHNLNLVAVTHIETEKENLLRNIRHDFPLAMQDEHPLTKVLRTRQAQLIADVTDAWVNTISQDSTYLDLMHALEPRSLMCVPLVARNRILGALTFILSASDRRYTPTDLVVAKDLASRVALAMDNLRLYHEAQKEIVERKQMEQQIRDYSIHLERNQQELVEANARLSVQASTDGLTGLNNHRAFQEGLTTEVQRALRYQYPVSLVLLDVDKFKQYNDTYGHPAGDQVLKQVASVLQTGARGTDFVARYGGEEFVVVLPNTDAESAQEAAERLRQAIEAQAWEQRPVTASFGVATLSAVVASASDLIAQADKALYHSKHTGRNRVTYAGELSELEQAFEASEETVEAIVSVRETPVSSPRPQGVDRMASPDSSAARGNIKRAA